MIDKSMFLLLMRCVKLYFFAIYVICYKISLLQIYCNMKISLLHILCNMSQDIFITNFMYYDTRYFYYTFQAPIKYS